MITTILIALLSVWTVFGFFVPFSLGNQYYVKKGGLVS